MINKRLGIVSGYFNPVHAGHLEYINAAKDDCDFLIAIVNNDKQVELKKSNKFMDADHRLKIIVNLKSIDDAFIAIDSDSTVCQTLKVINDLFSYYRTKIFYNSGDRQDGFTNINEDLLCKELGIERKNIILPKIYSSSNLINSVYNNR